MPPLKAGAATNAAYPRECDSKRIESVAVYRAKMEVGGATSKKTSKYRFSLRLYNIVFICLYIYQLAWVISSIGEPYRQFLARADREGFQGMNFRHGLLPKLTYNLDIFSL
jgi:hypothetical protein